MIANRSDLPAKSSKAAAAAVQALSPCYLAAPALPEVLEEQMAFLLAHEGHNTAGCSECLRLAQLVRILMRPFD
jgi:hypothetical protein